MRANIRTRDAKRVIVDASELSAFRSRVIRSGGRIVQSSPVGLNDYAVDYVTGVTR